MSTAIEWTDATWNPVTGCSKVSPGCAHCYAETIALRFWPSQYPKIIDKTSRTFRPLTRDRIFTDVMCHKDRLDAPLHWKKPRRVFVNSMSDLFHEDVPDEFIDRVFAVMALSPSHTFQILTKRAERMRAYLGDGSGPHVIRWAGPPGMYDRVKAAAESMLRGDGGRRVAWPLPNVWLGCSVENQHFADERIPLLLQTPAAIRFISAEPLLEEIDLTPHLHGDTLAAPGPSGFRPGPALDWVIIGGESGPKSRPFDLAWARLIVQQCQAASVPVFVKQLGAKPVLARDADGVFVPDYEYRFANRKGGDPLEWPEDLRVRQFPEVHR